MNKMILGAGTGRCGTVSLSKLLDECKNSIVTHELRPILPYKKDFKVYQEYVSRLLSLLDNKEKYVGDVSGYVRNYIDELIRDFPDIKIIWIKRNNEKTIKSQIEATKDISLWNNDTSHEFSVAHPTWKDLSQEVAARKFVERENNVAERWEEQYPNNFRIFDIEYLNSKEGQDKIFDFCEIDKEDRNYTANCRYNKLLNQ